MGFEVVAALISLAGVLGAVALGYWLGRRDARRRDFHEAYTSWVGSVRAVVKERAALVGYDHIEALKRKHPQVAGIVLSPSGRARAEHVRDCHTAEARLKDRETNLVLRETSDRFARRVRELTAFVMARQGSHGTDVYGPMFESIGVEQTVTEGLITLQQELRTDHPVLGRANKRLHPTAA